MTDLLPPRRGRAAVRRERRRRRRRRVVAVLTVLVLLAVAFAVYLAVDAPEPPAAMPSKARTQQTLALQIQGPNGAGIANALVAEDPAVGAGAVVLVPPQVLVNIPGTGSVPYGRALLSGSAETSRNGLSDLLGVTIDAGWILDLPTFAQLVDALGGVPVDVDVQVVQGRNVVLSPGRQNLDGLRAGVYLSYLAAGEPEQARLSRIQEVLDGVVNVLPRTPAELVPVLAGLGQRSSSTLTSTALADLLLRLAKDDEAGEVQYDVLPVVDLAPGGGLVSFRADETAVRQLVDRFFADSVPPGVRAGNNRFLVLNGVGTPGLGEAVRARLVPSGFVFVDARNAPSFGVAQTQILVPLATPEAQQLGERVAKALGLPATSVRAQAFGTVADVIVLVGADFTP